MRYELKCISLWTSETSIRPGKIWKMEGKWFLLYTGRMENSFNFWIWNSSKKATTNLGSILKSRDISLQTKVRLVKAKVFPVVMHGYANWTIKKAEHLRIDAFELWFWRGVLRVPWTAKRSNQSVLKEISPEYSLEGQMLKLKLQYFGHLFWRADSMEKTLMLGKTEGRRRRGRQDELVREHHQLNGHEFEETPGDTEGKRSLVCCSPWGCKESDTT